MVNCGKPIPAVPNFLAPGTSFVEDSFFHRSRGDGLGSNVSYSGGRDSGGNASSVEQRMKLLSLSLTHCSPPAVPPGS